MEDTLHPLVNYIIVPLSLSPMPVSFFGNMEISQLFHGIAPTIIVSLIGGKFLGIFPFLRHYAYC